MSRGHCTNPRRNFQIRQQQYRDREKEITLLHGQWKYSLRQKSHKPEWRVIDYLECMRDWSDPEWMRYYSEAITFYCKVLDAEIMQRSISPRST